MSTNVQRLRRWLATAKLYVWSATDRENPLAKDVSASPTLTSGSGAPTHTEPQGSVYLRTDGTTARTIVYANTDGSTTWDVVGDAEVLTDGTVTVTAAAGSISETGLVDLTLTGSGDTTVEAAGDSIFGSSGNSASALTCTVEAQNAGAGAGNLDLLAKSEIQIGDDTNNPSVTFPGSGGVTFESPLKSNTLDEADAGNGVSVDGVKLKDGLVLTDEFAMASIAVADASGGGTTAALTVDCTRMDALTVLASARQILITCSTAQYDPGGSLSGTATFGTATKGSIIASGNGWCLAQTSTGGEFDCTVTNSADEALYFRCQLPAGVSDVTKGLQSLVSNVDLATWSA